MTTTDGASFEMPVDHFDVDCLEREFGPSVSVENLQESLQPLVHSTPYQPKTTQRRQQRKRHKSSTNNTPTSEQKYKGCIQVPLCQIKLAPKGYCLIRRNSATVESFKGELRDKSHRSLPVFPVMVKDEAWTERDADHTDYYLLGGLSLWEAMVDLADDERFANYRRCMVNVHAALSEVEALEVGALFQQQLFLSKDELPNLEDKVDMCRRLLFQMHDLDIDVDEPPTRVKDEWRRKAAAALGAVTTPTHDGRKPLEPLFQLALYSQRCYTKLARIFAIHLANEKKPLKITVFLQLQGLTEAQRFKLLSEVVSGDIELKDVKALAPKLKRLGHIRKTMMRLTRMSTWEECITRFPIHSQDSALEEFIGKDMRKSVPQEFVEFLQEAEETRNGDCTSLEELQGSPVTLAVIEVQTTKRVKFHIKKLKEGARQLVVLADQLDVAATWQTEMRRSGIKNITEAVVVAETKAKHLIVGGEDERSIPKIIPDNQCFKTLLEMYSRPNVHVVCSVNNQAHFDEAAQNLQRVSRKLWTFRGEGCQEESSSSDDFEFVE